MLSTETTGITRRSEPTFFIETKMVPGIKNYSNADEM